MSTVVAAVIKVQNNRLLFSFGGIVHLLQVCVRMVDLVTKSAKWVNDVPIFPAAAVFEANVVKERFVNRISACVEVNVVVVVLMKSVSMVNAVVKPVHVIDVTMLVNRMRFVSMVNVFVFDNVEKVRPRTSRRQKRFRSSFHSSVLSSTVFERRTMYELLSMYVSSRLARSSM